MMMEYLKDKVTEQLMVSLMGQLMELTMVLPMEIQKALATVLMLD